MKNPYLILGIAQDASNEQIIRSQFEAMKKRIYTTKEIAEAKSLLSRPATRLAVDFTFPHFEDFSCVKLVITKVKSRNIDIDSFNPDKYDSLK